MGDVGRKERDQPQLFPAAVSFFATTHLKKMCLYLANLEAWWKKGGIYANLRERWELNCLVIWQLEWVMLCLGYQEASNYSVFS